MNIQANRSHEQTLAPSFASLQLKKLELEFTVDPLFKKASADFDEGGAKGLLLNHLSINSDGRIVFDSSDDTTNTKSDPQIPRAEESMAGGETVMQQTATGEDDQKHDVDQRNHPEGPQIMHAPAEQQDAEIDLDSLAAKFFPDLSVLDSQDICPSMKTFALGDPNSTLDLAILKAPEDWRDAHKNAESEDMGREPPPVIDIPGGEPSGIFLNSDNAAGFDDDDDDDEDGIGGAFGGFDIGADVGFGGGGEAWAKETALEPMLHISSAASAADGTRDGSEGIATGEFDPAHPQSDNYAVGLKHGFETGPEPTAAAFVGGDPTENLLSYFDATLQSSKASTSWAGLPQHWRIRKLKSTTLARQNNNQHPSSSDTAVGASTATTTTTTASRTRKEKEPFEIDFLSPMDQTLADMLYTPASSNAAISLPKAQWKTKDRNLLPDDRHFSSKSLLTLWLKPKAGIGKRKRRRVVDGSSSDDHETRRDGEERNEVDSGDPHVEMDEAYWARRREEDDRIRQAELEEEREAREAGELGRAGDYDANFFADDGHGLPFGPGLPDDVDDGDDDDGYGGGGVDSNGFTDANEMFSPSSSQQQQRQQLPLPPPGTRNDAFNMNQAPTTNFLPASFGAQLINNNNNHGSSGDGSDGNAPNRLISRPEYVNYARAAKKVDVRRLKENMWKGMVGWGFDRDDEDADNSIKNTNHSPDDGDGREDEKREGEDEQPSNSTDCSSTLSHPFYQQQQQQQQQPAASELAVTAAEEEKERRSSENAQRTTDLQFTSLIRNLTSVYPERQMRDISTSYCFICLLHLANEKGLVLESGQDTEKAKVKEEDKDEEGGMRRKDVDMEHNGDGDGVGGSGGGGDDDDDEDGGEEDPIMNEIHVRKDMTVGKGYVGE